MHTARFAPAVIGQIMDGERPAHVPDKVINELKGREHNGITRWPRSGSWIRGLGFQFFRKIAI